MKNQIKNFLLRIGLIKNTKSCSKKGHYLKKHEQFIIPGTEIIIPEMDNSHGVVVYSERHEKCLFKLYRTGETLYHFDDIKSFTINTPLT